VIFLIIFRELIQKQNLIHYITEDYKNTDNDAQ